MLLTRQGVRDLNGPGLNGRGHNGNKSTTCAHHRSPDLPTYRTTEIREVTIPDTHYGPRTEIREVAVYRCTSCDAERWHTGDEAV